MTSSVAAELLERAKVLSHEERGHLAYMLLHEDDETEADWWSSIEPELDAISDAIDSGEMGTVPVADVQRWMRQRLARED